jgi:hypothetical protein
MVSDKDTQMRHWLLAAFAVLAVAAPVDAQLQLDPCEDHLYMADILKSGHPPQTEPAITPFKHEREYCLTEQGSFTNDFGVVTFQYPAGWIFQIDDKSGVIFQDETLSDFVMDRLEPPAMAPGQVVIAVGVSVAEQMGYFEEDPEPTPALIVNVLSSGMPFAQEVLTVNTAEMKIDGRDAARITWVMETYALNVVLVDTGVDTTNGYGPLFAAVISVTAPDEYEAQVPLLEAIAVTTEIEYDPEILGGSDLDGHGPGG